jgi:polyphosphate kinase
MTRNLDRRVEVVTPVLSPHLKKYLKDTVLSAYLRDNVKARVMNSDGIYEALQIAIGEEPFNSQTYFEGVNSSPSAGSVHSIKRQRLWAKDT